MNGILEWNFSGPYIDVSSQQNVNIFVFHMTLNSHIQFKSWTWEVTYIYLGTMLVQNKKFIYYFGHWFNTKLKNKLDPWKVLKK
jgi:hypothetical protein